MKRFSQVLAGLTLFVALPLYAVGDAEAGKQKAAVCAACHGMDGNSTVAQWPKIAAQHEAYMVRHVTLIREGARMVPEMMGIASTLSDQDIEDLAAYFAVQSITPGAADPALVAVGERIYRAGNPKTGVPACMSCHGPTGQGNPLSGYPVLAGQHALYTANMLTKYKDGTHWGEDDAASNVMVGVASPLTTAEIQAVASYIQGLHQATD